MAKGKHAAESARRRADAAHEHIDRLTDQLVEAKERARRFEAAATRLPVVSEELERLRRQVEEGTSDQLERERELRRSQVAGLNDKLERLGSVMAAAIDRFEERYPDDERGLLIGSELAEVDQILGRAAKSTSSMTRRLRRQSISRGAIASALEQASATELRRVGIRRVGSLMTNSADVAS